MLKVTINQNKTIEVIQEKDQLLVDGAAFEWDIRPAGENKFSILHQNKSYNAEVVERNMADKTFKIKLNQQIFTVSAQDRLDLLLKQMGIADATATKINTIKAPMPGLIFELKIQPGDTVAKGDALLILVAMKMENVIKSPGDGKVKTIKVNLNDSVEKNQILIEFE